ncbi:MAG: hypothetical protein K2P81_03790 [Bacteriovoracaceae bacterium]|nr:hypothetical protein [Bacteriovoracaceae bacterium]
MARTLFSFILIFFVNSSLNATELEISFQKGYLGEKDSQTYSGPWRPEFHHDPYFGKISLEDESFFSGYFYPYIWRNASDWSRFLSEEVMGASTCPHPVLSKHFDEIRYGYRLIVLSYLLELMDSNYSDMTLLKKNNVCSFDLQSLLKKCKPKTSDMKKFLSNLSQQKPFKQPLIDKSHNYQSFEKEWLKAAGSPVNGITTSRLNSQCKQEHISCANLSLQKASELMQQTCTQDQDLFVEICSEEDQIYGMTSSPLITFLLSSSNLVNLFNDEGMAQGCLRRFGQMMASKERVHRAISNTQPVIYASLKKTWGERYPHGRAFIYGALKEFERKGLAQVFEEKVEKPKETPVVVAKPEPVVVAKIEAEKPKPVVVVVEKPVVEKKVEVVEDNKSAFLQAAEVRDSQNLERVDVDMLKFRYDYVFSMAELQLLSDTLKDYTKREALEEMRSWDKLGAKEAPMPLTFIKFLIDSQNHQGLFNVISVLGEKFWVIDDIDSKYEVKAEYVELRNDSSTGNSWQIFVMRPEL